MRDVASGDYGWHANATGLVIVFRAFDSFAAADRRTAQIMLDILAGQARSAILIGNRIICLVQSNDPRLSLSRWAQCPSCGTTPSSSIPNAASELLVALVGKSSVPA